MSAAITVLFTKKDSVYETLGADVWDINRDARNWQGGGPCIAHPPCRAWGQLSHMAKPRHDEKELSLFAIEMIRKYGGVLEHPAASRLWPHILPYPGGFDDWGGYSICIDQKWFGHLAQKKTLLYIVGCTASELPPIPIDYSAVEYTVSSKIKKKSGARIKKEIPKSMREHTPLALAKWLIQVAKCCKI